MRLAPLILLPFAALTAGTDATRFDIKPAIANPAAKVEIRYDGTSRKFISYATFVGEAILESEIPFEAGDASWPWPDETVHDGQHIEIDRGKPVTVYDDGRIIYAKSGYHDSVDILRHLGLDALPEDEISDSVLKSDFLFTGRMGRLVIVRRAPRIKIMVDGKETIYASWAGTVGEVLAQKGIKLEGKDYSAPDLDAPVHKGMSIRVFRVREFEETVHKVTPYKTLTSYETKISDSTNCQTRITQQGQDGITDTKYLVRTEDSEEVWRKKLEVAVIQQLQNHRIVKDRIISASNETGEGNWAWYSGYTAAYNGWGSRLSDVYGKKLLVTNLSNGRQVTVTIIDWGPQESTGDIIDLSRPAFSALGGSFFQGEIKNLKVQKILCEA